MVRRNIIGACITTALLLVAGFTAAATDITNAITGGGNADGGAEGHYEVDGSGAYSVAAETAGDAHGKLKDAYDQTGQLANERPAMPYACPNADVAAPDLPLDGVNELNVEHADSLSKTVNADTGLVNADADVSAWGHVKGWFTGIADALTGLFDDARTAEAPDTCSTIVEVTTQAEASLALVDEARGSLDGVMATELDTPDLEPSVSGDYAFQHAGEVSSDVTGLVDVP